MRQAARAPYLGFATNRSSSIQHRPSKVEMYRAPLQFHDADRQAGWDISMFTDFLNARRARTAAARLTVLALSAALVVTMVEPLPAAAAASKLTRPTASGSATDFSAARRRGHLRRYVGRRHRGAGPGLAMMGMMIGAIGGIVAAERRRAYYEDVPVVYAPQPQPYYGPQPYYDNGYAPGYYGYAPQPYPVAPVYAAPVAPVYSGGRGFVHHAGPSVVHAAPQLNIARAIPRFVPQGHHRHH
jgi:hypothetical protein